MSHETQKWEMYGTQGDWRYWRTYIGWLEITLDVHPQFDCSFSCPQVGYKNYSTHTKDADEARETAMIHVLSRLKSLFELAGKVDELSKAPA